MLRFSVWTSGAWSLLISVCEDITIAIMSSDQTPTAVLIPSKRFLVIEKCECSQLQFNILLLLLWSTTWDEFYFAQISPRHGQESRKTWASRAAGVGGGGGGGRCGDSRLWMHFNSLISFMQALQDTSSTRTIVINSSFVLLSMVCWFLKKISLWLLCN